MDNQKRDFDKGAATWDEEPKRVALANDIGQAIIQNLPLTDSMDVLDFGCGTGLLTFHLQPLVRSVTGVDSSGGMLDVLTAKAAKLQVKNVRTQFRDLEKGDVLSGSYHLIVSSMTLHHIREIAPLLRALHEIIVPSGSIALADLDPDDGQFHADNTGVFHNGVERAWLQQQLEDAGFVDVQHLTASRLEKPVAGGGSREFSVFLMTARKK